MARDFHRDLLRHASVDMFRAAVRRSRASAGAVARLKRSCPAALVADGCPSRWKTIRDLSGAADDKFPARRRRSEVAGLSTSGTTRGSRFFVQDAHSA